MNVLQIEAIDTSVRKDGRPNFRPGDRIRISSRVVMGHQRMPFYLLGKRGTVEAVLEPPVLGDDRGQCGETPAHLYQLAIPMTEIWPDYVGAARDGLRIEVLEPWLVRA